jgi:hypothetical protein
MLSREANGVSPCWEAIFELADIWCEGVEADEYVEFLNRTLWDTLQVLEALPADGGGGGAGGGAGGGRGGGPAPPGPGRPARGGGGAGGGAGSCLSESPLSSTAPKLDDYPPWRHPPPRE